MHPRVIALGGHYAGMPAALQLLRARVPRSMSAAVSTGTLAGNQILRAQLRHQIRNSVKREVAA